MFELSTYLGYNRILSIFFRVQCNQLVENSDDRVHTDSGAVTITMKLLSKV